MTDPVTLSPDAVVPAPRRRYRSASPVWWVIGALVGFGIVVLVRDYHAAVRVFTGGAALALALSLLTALVGGWILRRIRPLVRARRSVALACLAWGATAATGCAILANGGLGAIWSRAAGIEFASDWGAALTAPVNEELLKLSGLVLLALALPGLVRGPMDGFCYGAFVGLGFQVTENWTYAINSIVLGGATADTSAVFDSFVGRVLITGWGSHWSMTAVAGAGAGLVLGRRVTGRRVAAAVGLVAVAMGMHLLFDAPVLPGIGGTATKTLVDLAIAALVYTLCRRRVRLRARAALERVGQRPGELLSRRRRRRARRALPAGAERDGLAHRQRELLAAVEAEAFGGEVAA